MSGTPSFAASSAFLQAVWRTGGMAIGLNLTSSAFAAAPVVHRDLPYSEPKQAHQCLDLYAPPTGKNHPMVVWIHGGGWQKGSKEDIDAKPEAFVARGCVFVSINYRLIPEATVPEMAGDVAKAIHWVYDQSRNFGGDPDSIFVAGHSAGAQLAALVCTDERYLKAEGLALNQIKGCIPVDGGTYYPILQIETHPSLDASFRLKFPAPFFNQ
jgi:arylformamidase